MELPSDMFDDDWLKANFNLPADDAIFKEELAKLEGRCYCDALYRPGNTKKLLKLRALIAAMKAHQEIFDEAKKAAKKLKAA